MKKNLVLLCALMCISITYAQTKRERLEHHVYYMAADSLEGRKAGSEMSHKVADYIVAEFSEIGLKPYFDSTYLHHFKLDIAPNNSFRNVVGWFEGNDPQLKDELIVIGAHYDHLGIRNGEVYNGADDNASGTATVIEMARMLAEQRHTLKRSVVLAAFDAEEMGLYGSRELCKIMDKEKVKLMVSIDMVGWLSNGEGKLTLEGAATIKEGKKIIKTAAEGLDIEVEAVNFETSMMGATDTEYFAMEGIPTLYVSTGLKSPYHKPEDDAELIDYDGLNTVTDYMTNLVINVANDEELASSGRLSFKHTPLKGFETGISASYGSYFLKFADGDLLTGNGDAYNVGLSATYHMKRFSLEAEALYEKSTSKYPDTDNLFTNSLTYRQEAITVPVTLKWRANSGRVHMFLGAGGYYSHNLWGGIKNSDIDLKPADDSWGWHWQFGFAIYKYQFMLTRRYGMSDVFEGAAAPEVQSRHNYFTFKRLF